MISRSNWRPPASAKLWQNSFRTIMDTRACRSDTITRLSDLKPEKMNVIETNSQRKLKFDENLPWRRVIRGCRNSIDIRQAYLWAAGISALMSSFTTNVWNNLHNARKTSGETVSLCIIAFSKWIVFSLFMNLCENKISLNFKINMKKYSIVLQLTSLFLSCLVQHSTAHLRTKVNMLSLDRSFKDVNITPKPLSSKRSGYPKTKQSTLVHSEIQLKNNKTSY